MNRARDPKRRLRGQRGWLLFPIVVLLVLVAGLTTTLLESTLADERSQQMHETSFRAMQIAEMGLLRAENEIRGGTDHDGDGLGDLSGSYGGGSYEVEATQDPGDPQRWTIVARGVHGLSGRRLEVHDRFLDGAAFFTGLFGRDSLDVRGSSQTDSYDSRLGPYGSQAGNWDPDYGQNYADPTGHVGSNGPIVVDETGPGTMVKIRGDAKPGPADVVTIVGTPEIFGSTAPASAAAGVPDTPFADFQAAHDSPDNAVWATVPGYSAATRSLSLSSPNSVTLAAGTYFLRDLVVQNGAQIRITGPVRLYVTQSFDLRAGSVNNQTKKPSQFVIYLHDHPLPAAAPPAAGVESTINGGSNTYLAIYAPSVDVKYNGNSELYGAVVARNLKFSGNARFHFDRALMDEVIGGLPPPPERILWIDRAVPRR